MEASGVKKSGVKKSDVEESVRIRHSIEKLAAWACRFMMVLGLLIPVFTVAWLSYLMLPLGGFSLMDSAGAFQHCQRYSDATQFCLNFKAISGDIMRDYYLSNVVTTFYFVCSVVLFFNLFSLFSQLKKGVIFSKVNTQSTSRVLNWALLFVVGKSVLDCLIWFLYTESDAINTDFLGAFFFYLLVLLCFYCLVIYCVTVLH